MRLSISPEVEDALAPAELARVRAGCPRPTDPCPCCHRSLGDQATLALLDDGRLSVPVFTHPGCLPSGVYPVKAGLHEGLSDEVRVSALTLTDWYGQVVPALLVDVDAEVIIREPTGHRDDQVDAFTAALLTYGWSLVVDLEGPATGAPLPGWQLRYHRDEVWRVEVSSPGGSLLVSGAPIRPEARWVTTLEDTGVVLVWAGAGLHLQRTWQYLPQTLATAVVQARLCQATIAAHPA